MKIIITPDKEKAKSLLDLAEVTLQRLGEINSEKYPANTLIDYYDIIHQILEAISLIDGIKIHGEGAHQELIDYVAKAKKLNEAERFFLQELRDYRNRISYEGLKINEQFLIRNHQKIKEIISKLKNLIKL